MGVRRFIIPSLACRLQNAGVLLPTRLKLGRREQESCEQRAISSSIWRRIPVGIAQEVTEAKEICPQPSCAPKLCTQGVV